MENTLNIWKKLQKNMERFSYFQDNTLFIERVEAITYSVEKPYRVSCKFVKFRDTIRWDAWASKV
jgi:hypothetical protein